MHVLSNTVKQIKKLNTINLGANNIIHYFAKMKIKISQVKTLGVSLLTKWLASHLLFQQGETYKKKIKKY